MGSEEPLRKKAKFAEPADEGLGGLYDFLPPPDPAKDAAAKVQASKSGMSKAKLPAEDRTRAIFLDVDGVILPSGSVDMIVIDGVSLPTRDAVRESDFSTTALGSLRWIVQQTGAIIVLSSEWRRTDPLKSSIATVLKSQDIPVFRDCTPLLTPKPDLQKAHPIIAWCERRAREITKWLKDHPEVTAWVALDDLNFEWADNVRSAGTQWMKIRSVHTNDKICLTEEGAEEAVNILLNPPPEPKVLRRPVSEAVAASSGLFVSTEDSMPEKLRLG